MSHEGGPDDQNLTADEIEAEAMDAGWNSDLTGNFDEEAAQDVRDFHAGVEGSVADVIAE